MRSIVTLGLGAALLSTSVLARMSEGSGSAATTGTTDAPPATAVATPASEGEVTIKDDDAKERKFFKNSDVETHGFEYIQTLMGAYEKLPTFSNFDLESAELPEGFGLMIQPLTKRNAEKGEPMQLTGFIFAFVPETASVLESPEGAAFMENALLEVFSRKLKTTIANSEPGEPIVLVNTLEGFLQKQSRGEGLSDFNLAAPEIVKSLAKAGFKGMDKTILRHCFMSEKFASLQYAKVPQKVWLALLDKAKQLVNTKGKPGTLFDTWKATRAERDFSAGELDLSELGLSLDEAGNVQG